MTFLSESPCTKCRYDLYEIKCITRFTHVLIETSVFNISKAWILMQRMCVSHAKLTVHIVSRVSSAAVLVIAEIVKLG